MYDPYVEAIVGAIYYDSNYETTRRWVNKILIPLLKKYCCTTNEVSVNRF